MQAPRRTLIIVLIGYSNLRGNSEQRHILAAVTRSISAIVLKTYANETPNLQCEPVEVSLVAVQRRVPTSTTEELTTWWRKQRRQRTWSTTRTFQCDQSSTDNPECGDNKSQVCTFC